MSYSIFVSDWFFICESCCSGIRGELSALVQASPSVRDKLGPALLHTYAAVSVIEGLDVDKESFDKFSTRYTVFCIDMLLRTLQCFPISKKKISRKVKFSVKTLFTKRLSFKVPSDSLF